jgi:hypothetical protein
VASSLRELFGGATSSRAWPPSRRMTSSRLGETPTERLRDDQAPAERLGKRRERPRAKRLRMSTAKPSAR